MHGGGGQEEEGVLLDDALTPSAERMSAWFSDV